MSRKHFLCFGTIMVLLFANHAIAMPGEDWINLQQKDVATVVKIENGNIQAGETLTVPLEVPVTGDYHVVLSYRPVQTSTFHNTVLVDIAGEQMRSTLPFLWEDIFGEKRYDKYGNEIPPDQQLCDTDSRAYLEEYAQYARMPYVFPLTAGLHAISITPESLSMSFETLTLIHKQRELTYQEYKKELAGRTLGTDFVTIEAEDYLIKNDSFIRGINVKNTAVSPHDPYVKRINVLAAKSFRTAGQKVLYEFDISRAGRYAIAFTYSQPLKPGMPVFRTIEVDGEVPFSEFRDVTFAHTGMNVYGNRVLGEGEPYYIYLDEGRHTLGIKVTAAPIDAIYARLTEIIGEMNAVTLRIKKLTGQNSDISSNIDTNRTWNVLDYMPTILDDIAVWQDELLTMYQTLRQISGTEPTFANDLRLAAENLERLKEDPRKLPNKITLLGDDASSAAQLLGTLLSKLSEQDLSIDRIYVYDGLTELPSSKESLSDRFKVGVRQFLYSFSPIMNESASHGQDGRLTVWVNKPSQYADVLQNLCTKDFTAKTGIDVTFSIMPREDKLILANASSTNPDVVVGISGHYPFDFGVRGIAKNLLEYEDFPRWYSAEYNLESLVPFSFDGGIYAACETQEFRVLFYRKDILEMLGLTIPNTMDDVRAMLPTLHRNAMNFSIPLSTNKEGFKGFQQTMPFVYQNEGDVYSENGMSATLTDPNTVKGLQEMCDLYRVYGCQINVKSFFNSFRSGVIPLGISEYATYLQLQTIAPELADLWDIALVPGVMAEDGKILRYQAAVDTATMILSNTNMPNEAYAFLKWWLSSETQVNYANELQRKYGPDYKWNTANLVAFEHMGFPESHKQVILEMWRNWQKETPRHVASYMLEREISNLWGYVVKENKPFMPCVDQAQQSTNREMMRKLNEFGFVDEKGNVLKPYNNHTVEDVKGLLLRKEARK